MSDMWSGKTHDQVRLSRREYERVDDEESADWREEVEEHQAERHGAPAGPESRASRVAPKTPRKPPKLAPLALVIILIAFTAVLSYAQRARPVNIATENAEDYDSSHFVTQSSNFLGRNLNPEDHVGRHPRTIQLEWNITLGSRRPDGVKKDVYLVNDHFPGPTIEAAAGDDLDIAVYNGLYQEGVAIHWHGLHMHNANLMDGAVGVTQKPIKPGVTFHYRFEIPKHQHGTFWYHAHDRVQRGDGLYGGLVIHDSKEGYISGSADQLLLIGDWYHQSAQQTMDRYMEPGTFGNEPVPDSLIINDKGAYTCADASPSRPVDCTDTPEGYIPALNLGSTKQQRLRVVNTGTLAGFSLTIPGYNMTAIEIDGGNAVVADGAERVGVVYPGQRVDLLVTPTNDNMPMLQVELDDDNFRDPNPALTSTQSFPVVLDGKRRQLFNEQNGKPRALDLMSLDAGTEANHKLLQVADKTIVIYTTTMKMSHRDNVPRGYINQTSWMAQKEPLLSQSRDKWDDNQLVPYIPLVDDGLWIDLVINNIDDGGHPFHLHGYSFYVLQISQRTSFFGSYNPFEDAKPPGGELNTRNPVMRDTVFVPRRGYAVIRFKADNPGLWFAHCHLLSHQASGMAMTFHIGGSESHSGV